MAQLTNRLIASASSLISERPAAFLDAARAVKFQGAQYRIEISNGRSLIVAASSMKPITASFGRLDHKQAIAVG